MTKISKSARTRIFQMIAALAAAMMLVDLGAAFDRGIAWTEDFEGAVQRSAATNSVLLVHFYTDNCPPCKLLDKKTFQDPGLVSTMNENVIPVRINADKRRELADRFNVTRWPTDIYFFPNGEEIYRGVSDQDPAVYAQKIKRVALRNRDWNVERLALAKAQQKKQDLELANRPQPIQSERPVYAGSAGHSVKSQSAAWTSRPDAAPSVPVVSAFPQRVIENPYISKQPIAVPPSTVSNQPTNADVKVAPVVPAQDAFAGGLIVPAKPVVNAQPISSQRPVPGATVNNSNSQPNPNQQPLVAQQPTSMQVPAMNSVVNNDVTSAQPSVRSPTLQDPAPRREQLPAATSAQSNSQKVVAETIGLEGYCPVALVQSLTQSTGEGWVRGSPSFAVRHRGRVYYCSSEKARQTLLSSPDRYTPCLSGFDLVHFCKTGTLIDGKCEFGQSQSDRVFLFANKENCDEFIKESQHYSQLMENAATERVANGTNETRIR